MSYGDEYQSIYCYRGTDVLINRFNIKNKDMLDRVEADITRKNIAALHMNPVKGNFNLKHLQDIHIAIFSDIYPFAGEIRSEIISKGTTMFALPQFIYENCDSLFGKLRKESFFKRQAEIEEFSKKMAFYMSEINIIHPFREGNGRATREFIRELGIKCGYNIEWDRITNEDLLNASIRSVLNPDFIELLIKKAISLEQTV